MRKVDPAKHVEKRRHILEAATTCFQRDGFHGASISDICAEAAMSPGHLYHYFDCKEAIIKAITETGLERVAVTVGQVAQEADLVDALAARLVAKLDQLKRDGEDRRKAALMAEMTAEAARNPAVAKILRDHDRRIREMVACLLRHGQERGQVDRGLDPDFAAAAMIAAFRGLHDRAINDRGPDIKREADALKLMITRFLRPQEAAPARPAPKRGAAKGGREPPRR